MTKNTAFALIDSRGYVMLDTICRRRKDVPDASENWSGYAFAQMHDYGYRIVKVNIVPLPGGMNR
jgi:hypothetical protein